MRSSLFCLKISLDGGLSMERVNRGPSQERSYVRTACPSTWLVVEPWRWVMRQWSWESRPKSSDLGSEANKCCGLILVHASGRFPQWSRRRENKIRQIAPCKKLPLSPGRLSLFISFLDADWHSSSSVLYLHRSIFGNC